MAEDSSEDEYIDSQDDADSDSEGQGSSTPQRQSRQNVRSQERSVSRSRGLVDETDLMVETSERQPRETKSRSRQPSQRKSRSRQSSAGQASRTSREQSQSSQPDEKVDGKVTREYCDLLNDMIADASSHTVTTDRSLWASQIGMTIWSAYEKSALFEALERYGPGDLPGLTRAVQTKSQYEIQVYLSLLQKGLATQRNPASQQGVLVSDTPAAVDIVEDCELALNTAADALSFRVEKQEQLVAQTTLGDDWLIDAEAAEAEDQSYEESLATGSEVVEDDVSTTDAESAKSDHVNLLRSSAFLQLSRNLFMNNGEHEEWNWHHVDLITDASDEPAIFRRAMNDLRALTINLTRRLVQASIFQAMTRLRASDSARADWTPLAAVREVDVRSAVEVLNLGPNWHEYWARVPRRCRVTVFSDSKKYNDGRAGTKAGFPITYEEVETELGIDNIADEPQAGQAANAGLEEPDRHSAMADSDAYTDAAEDTSGDEDAARGSRGPKVDGFSSARKRKRPLSPRSLARMEDERTESYDKVLSAQEQIRLWKKLRLEPPQSLVEASMATQRPLPAQSGICSESVTPDWRDAVEYQSAWESELGAPDLKDFRDMALRGRTGHKRRRMVREDLDVPSCSKEDGRSKDRDSVQGMESSEDGGVGADEHDSEDAQTYTGSESE